MRKNLLGITVLIFLLFAGALYFRKESRAPTLTMQDVVEKEKEKEQASPPTITVEPTKQSETSMKISPPSMETVTSQAKNNPHVTPIALIQFADELGQKMEKAMASEEAATSLFGDLESCMNMKSTARPAKALCLDDARRLSEKYPSLKDRYRSLNQSADPETLRLSRFAETGAK